MMRRFLLGESGAEEQETVEERFMTDPAYFEALCALEDELVLSHVRGDFAAALAQRLRRPRARRPGPAAASGRGRTAAPGRHRFQGIEGTGDSFRTGLEARHLVEADGDVAGGSGGHRGGGLERLADLAAAPPRSRTPRSRARQPAAKRAIIATFVLAPGLTRLNSDHRTCFASSRACNRSASN